LDGKQTKARVNWPVQDPHSNCPPGTVYDGDPAGAGRCVDPYEKWRKDEATASYAKCTVKCVATVAAKEVGLHFALEGAAHKMAWQFGKKALPYVGWVSAAYGGYEAIQCFVECDDPKKCH
jgi:hypothetical protein